MNLASRIWGLRDVIVYTSLLELKLKYKGTVLGFLWSVLEPLAQLAILYAVFSFLYSSGTSFVIYLFSGLIMIHLFSRGTTQAMNSLAAKKPIILSINIQKIIFPLSSVLTNVFMFGIEVIIFFIFIAIFQFTLTINVLLLTVIFGLLIVLTTGVSLIISVLRTYLKDFQTLWSIVTMSLIFICPVFWYVKDMPAQISQIFLLNPLALLIEMTHQVAIFHIIPSYVEFSYVIGTSFGILLVGYYLFKRTEKKLVELL